MILWEQFCNQHIVSMVRRGKFDFDVEVDGAIENFRLDFCIPADCCWWPRNEVLAQATTSKGVIWVCTGSGWVPTS